MGAVAIGGCALATLLVKKLVIDPGLKFISKGHSEQYCTRCGCGMKESPGDSQIALPSPSCHPAAAPSSGSPTVHTPQHPSSPLIIEYDDWPTILSHLPLDARRALRSVCRRTQRDVAPTLRTLSLKSPAFPTRELADQFPSAKTLLLDLGCRKPASQRRRHRCCLQACKTLQALMDSSPQLLRNVRNLTLRAPLELLLDRGVHAHICQLMSSLVLQDLNLVIACDLFAILVKPKQQGAEKGCVLWERILEPYKADGVSVMLYRWWLVNQEVNAQMVMRRRRWWYPRLAAVVSTGLALWQLLVRRRSCGGRDAQMAWVLSFPVKLVCCSLQQLLRRRALMG